MRRLLCAFVWVLISFDVASAATSVALDAQPQEAGQTRMRGRVVDATGAAIVGAQVTVTSDRPGTPTSVVTNQQGEFDVTLVSGTYTVRVSANGFTDESRRITVSQSAVAAADFSLKVAVFEDSVSVGATIGYSVPHTWHPSSPTTISRASRRVALATSQVSS